MHYEINLPTPPFDNKTHLNSRLKGQVTSLSTPAEKTTPAQDYKCILRLENDFNQKSVNIGMISARHTTNRQSFKKVTRPFIIDVFGLDIMPHTFSPVYK